MGVKSVYSKLLVFFFSLNSEVSQPTTRFKSCPSHLLAFAIEQVKKLFNNKNFHSMLVGMQNDKATLEDGLAVSDKAKYTLTILSSNQAPRYLPTQMN